MLFLLYTFVSCGKLKAHNSVGGSSTPSVGDGVAVDVVVGIGVSVDVGIAESVCFSFFFFCALKVLCVECLIL